MSLVLYPDSESEGDELKAQHAPRPALPAEASTTRERGGPKRKLQRAHHVGSSALPPLPAAFHDLYSTNARLSTSDDPSLHGGRKRAVPHIEGNWPSHVYLEWIPSHTESKLLHRLIQSVQEAIETANNARTKPLPIPDITPSLRSPLGTPLPLHISLSRTLQIRTDDRDEFLNILTLALRKAAVKPFDIRFTTLKWVPNFEGNRWFLVLSIEKPPEDELNRLLYACNDACEECGHPGLYTGEKGDGPMERNPSSESPRKRRRSSAKGEKTEGVHITERLDRTENFHISIAWNLLEPAPEWIALLRDIDVNKIVDQPTAPFNVVKAKIGNAVHNIPLGSKIPSAQKGGGILGLG